MGGLKENNGSITFLNIKEGRLNVKQPNGSIKAYGSIGGVVTKVSFSKDQFEGKEYERAKIIITNGEERYMLQMNTESGYFRGFCNSLRSASDLHGEVEISPSYKKEGNSNPQTTCFIKQYDKTLKHRFTKDNMGDFPELKIIERDGKRFFDNSGQIEYWKKWLLDTYGEPEAEGIPETTTQDDIPDSIGGGYDDLPF